MRKGYLIALVATVIFAIVYSYYAGFLKDFFLFAPPVKKIVKVKVEPLVKDKDVNRVLKELEDFPKSEVYLRRLVSMREREVKDPFFPVGEEEVSQEKVEVKLTAPVKPVVEVPPPMKLEGIIEMGKKKVAILWIGNEKGVILSEGESWHGVKLVKVGKGNVVVLWKKIFKVLYLPEQR